MKKIRKISLIVLSLCCVVLPDSKYENIAFCLNSSGEVMRKGIARNGKIFKGDVIYNGDKIIVGIDGFVAIRNIHERSEIKIFKNSSVKVFSRKNRMNGEKEFEVVILGGRVIVDKNEFNNNTITIKNLQGIKGENQISIPKEKLVNEVKKFL